MKFKKMSNYIREFKGSKYGFVLDTSSVVDGADIRAKMWTDITKLLAHVGTEWLPGPMDLSNEPLKGEQLWLHYTDEFDRNKFYANPGLNYDYYVAEVEKEIIGVLAAQYNRHQAFDVILEEPNLSVDLSEYMGKFAYCSTFYLRRVYRDGDWDQGLLDYALTSLVEKGYKYLLLDVQIDNSSEGTSNNFNLNFFRRNGWKEIGKVFPDKRRTCPKTFPNMEKDRRSKEIGTIWLWKKIAE